MRTRLSTPKDFEVATNFAADVIPIINAAHAASEAAVCSAFAGTNDIALNGDTAAQVWASATSYWNQAVAAGSDWNVGWTILPRGTDPTFEAQRQLYNAQMRADFATIGVNIVSDVGADPSMGNPANVTNPILYQGDEIHPAPAGQIILTNYYAYAVMAKGSTATVTSITPNTGPMAGGTVCIVRGTEFRSGPALRLTVGGIQANEVVVIDDTTAQCTTGKSYGTGVGPVFAYTGNGSAALSGGGFTWT